MTEPMQIEVSAGSYSLKVSGLQPVAQVGQYVADAIGIIGEPLGYVKDSFASFRIHREQAAAAAMVRANEIAEENGTKIKSVSPKLLAPWIEGASLEDLGGDNVLELWAILLAGAPEEFDPYFAAYTKVLSSIGPNEAKTFDEIVDVTKLRGVVFGCPPQKLLDVEHCMNLTDHAITELGTYLGSLTGYTNDSFSDLALKSMKKASEQVPSQFINLSWEVSSGYMAGGIAIGVNEYAVLGHVGLVNRRQITREFDGLGLVFDVAELSEIGIKFYHFLHSQKLRIDEGCVDREWFLENYPEAFLDSGDTEGSRSSSSISNHRVEF